MECLELKKDLYYIGVIDHDLKVFDVAVMTDYGTSYNSYLLKTKDGVILFEGCKAVFKDEYIEHIKMIASIEEVKYIFVTHTEPDHSGAIEALLDLNPEITVVASPLAIANLDNIIRKPFKRQPTTPAGMEFGGYHFKFVSGMLLHWPDVMFTYIEELKTLVSCDAFGAHFASDAILLSKEPDKDGYYKALDYYFRNIMGPFGDFVLKACDRVEALDVDMMLVGHGPVVDTGIPSQINRYRELAKEVTPINDPKKVTIVWSSAYGYTTKMAEILKGLFENDGIQVDAYNVDATNYGELKSKVLESIRTSGTVLFGSPTIVGAPVILITDLIDSIFWTTAQSKKASAFGDYGWSGEAVDVLLRRLGDRKFKVVCPGFKYKFKLDDCGKEALKSFYDSLK